MENWIQQSQHGGIMNNYFSSLSHLYINNQSTKYLFVFASHEIMSLTLFVVRVDYLGRTR